MRRVHPAIADLQRRNRAAGRRLSPIDENRQTRRTYTHGDTHTINSNNSNNVNSHSRRVSPQTQVHRTSSASAVHAASVRSHPKSDESRPMMTSRFMSTAPTGGGGGDNSNNTNSSNNNNNRMKRDESRGANRINNNVKNTNSAIRIEPKPPVRRLPTKPRSSIHVIAANNIPSCNDNGISAGDYTPANEENSPSTDNVTNTMRNAVKPAVASNSKVPNESVSVASSIRYGFGFNKNRSFGSKNDLHTSRYSETEDFNEEDEAKSITEYEDPENWNHMLPDTITALLDGERLENPFTTNIWSNAQDPAKLKVSGYYACIRCQVPVVSPGYQVNYIVRGMAAFGKFNKKALKVHVAYIPAASTFGVSKNDLLELHVRCRCCNGFLGILAPNSDLDLPGNLTHLFVVNSSCLRFIKGGRTRCRLDEIYETEENEEEETKTEVSSKSIEMDFDDPNIFEL